MFKTFRRNFARVTSFLDVIATIQHTRWALIIIMLGIACSPLITVSNDLSAWEEEKTALKPDYAPEILISMRDSIIADFQQGENNPQSYFKALRRKTEWEAAASKFTSGSVWNLSEEVILQRKILDGSLANLQIVVNTSHQAYTRKFGGAMVTEGEKFRKENLQFPWEKVNVNWSPNLGQKFFFAWIMVGLLSLFFTFLRFVEEGNVAAFTRRMLWIVPMAFVVGPFTSRWAKPEEGVIASDLVWLANAASAIMCISAPGAAMCVKAQTTTPSKGKASVSRTSSGSENASETSGDVIGLMKRLGINSLAVEALPATADGTLRELSIEYTATTPLGRLGKVNWFGFGELRPGSQFTNHSASFMPTFVGAMSEQGWNGKKLFWDAGGKVSLTAAPKVGKSLGKAFNFLSVAYTHGIITAPKHQIIVAWATKDWSAWSGKLKFRSEGFYRIRPGDVTNYGQPQILVQFGNCTKVKALVQFDTPGRSVGVSAGAKFYFNLR